VNIWGTQIRAPFSHQSTGRHRTCHRSRPRPGPARVVDGPHWRRPRLGRYRKLGARRRPCRPLCRLMLSVSMWRRVEMLRELSPSVTRLMTSATGRRARQCSSNPLMARARIFDAAYLLCNPASGAIMDRASKPRPTRLLWPGISYAWANPRAQAGSSFAKAIDPLVESVVQPSLSTYTRNGGAGCARPVARNDPAHHAERRRNESASATRSKAKLGLPGSRLLCRKAWPGHCAGDLWTIQSRMQKWFCGWPNRLLEQLAWQRVEVLFHEMAHLSNP
jgi:hypothetical protein